MSIITKKTRKAGRPTRQNVLETTLIEAVLSGSEELVKAYPRAVKYLINLLDNEAATAASRLNAAKVIKESCETTLVDMADPKDNKDTLKETSNAPILNLIASKK